MKKLEIPLIEALNEAWIESAGDLLEDSGYKSVIEHLTGRISMHTSQLPIFSSGGLPMQFF